MAGAAPPGFGAPSPFGAPPPFGAPQSPFGVPPPFGSGAPPPFGAPAGFAPAATPALLPGLQLAVVGTDKQLRVAHVSASNTHWSVVSPAPVELASAPSLASFGGALFVFVLGADRKVHYNVQAATGAWGGWAIIPDGEFHDEPTAVTFQNTLYVFMRGTNSQMYFKTLTQSWSNWQDVPGSGLTSSALTATVSDDQLTLVIRGTDNRVYTSALAGGRWQPTWTEMPGNALIAASPGAVAYNRCLQVIVRGTDDRIYQQFRNQSGQYQPSWTEVPGSGLTHHGPVATLHGYEVHVYLRGTDGNLYRNTLNSVNQWTGWSPIPAAGSLAFAPGAGIV